jgi:hypothetical protein
MALKIERQKKELHNFFSIYCFLNKCIFAAILLLFTAGLITGQ